MDAEANNNNSDQIDVGILNADESNEQQQPSGESATAGGENVGGAADNDDSNSYGGEEPSSLYDVCEYLHICATYNHWNISIFYQYLTQTKQFYLFPVCVSYIYA